MSYSALTDNQIKYIQQRIENATWQSTAFLRFFRNHEGLIKNVGKGHPKKHIFATFEKMNPGQISAGFHDLPDSHIRINETTTNLMLLATKVVIPQTWRDAWASNRLIGEGDMLTQVLNQQLSAFYNQVDQFIAQGDSMKDPLTDDHSAGESQYTGLFNGFTNLSAGDGGDDDVTAAGDYISTFTNYKNALKAAGFDAMHSYLIMSTIGTEAAAEQGNNIYTSNIPTTERDAIMARDDVADWIATTNAENASGEDQILVTAPYTNEGDPNYRLVQGYSFDVFPLYAGGLGPTGMYELVVAWSGAIEEIRATSVQRSGALTLS